MSAASARLPECEWKFDGVSDDELEACFWWEYLRTGLHKTLRKDLKREYATARLAWDDEGIQWLSDFICDSPRGMVRKRFVKPVVLLRFLASEEVIWVPNADGKRWGWRRPADFFFETCSWLQVPQAAREHLACGFPSSFGSVLLLDLHRSERVEELPKKLPPQLKGYQPKPIGHVEFVRDVPADPRTSWFALQVDWRFRDTAIVSALKRLLAQRRPTDCPEPKQGDAGSIAQSALGSTRVLKTALRDLGVFRRRNELPDWDAFRVTYPTRAVLQSDHKDPTEDRHLDAAMRRAKGVIAWMGDGDRRHLKEVLAEADRKRAARTKRTKPVD